MVGNLDAACCWFCTAILGRGRSWSAPMGLEMSGWWMWVYVDVSVSAEEVSMRAIRSRRGEERFADLGQNGECPRYNRRHSLATSFRSLPERLWPFS